MGETCKIINASKKEQLNFTHIRASTPREFAGNPAAAAIVTWYLNINRGDYIAIVGDYDDSERLPFGLTYKEIDSWPDRTDEIVANLIEEQILKDFGRVFEDEEDPNNVYLRDLRNCWNENQSR